MKHDSLQSAMDNAHKHNELDKLERHIADLLADAGRHEQSARVARDLANKLTNDRAILLEAHSYGQEELEKGFALVQPTDDWKAPICAVLPTSVDLRLVRAAITHFTATIPRFTFLGGDKVRVSSIGYRAGPAGDH